MKPRVYKDPRTGHWICAHNGGHAAFSDWTGALRVALLATREERRRPHGGQSVNIHITGTKTADQIADDLATHLRFRSTWR